MKNGCSLCSKDSAASMIRSQIGALFKIDCSSVLDKERSGIQEVFAFWDWFGEPFDFSVSNF